MHEEESINEKIQVGPATNDVAQDKSELFHDNVFLTFPVWEELFDFRSADLELLLALLVCDLLSTNKHINQS